MIDLVYVFDQSYENPTIVSALSVIKNNNHLDIAFHLVVPFSAYKEAENVKTEISSHAFKCNIYGVKEEEIKKFELGLVKHRRVGTQSQPMHQTVFLKILLPQILKLNQCIYIDGDTIVGKCIEDLNNETLGNHFVAAIRDMSSASVLNNNYIKKYGLRNYFNSGVLLMNLDKLRKYDFVKKAIDIDIELGEGKQFADQDLFNIVLRNKVKFIDERYNLQTYYMHGLSKTLEIIQKSEKGVLHFIGPVKPWQNWSKERLQKLWNQYLTFSNTKLIQREKIKTLEQQLLFARTLDCDEEFKKASEIKFQIIRKLLSIGKNKNE
ncbi:hypothetical protein N9P07_05270 [Alphaproteobacteria bacterium]|nr:hypothetical protein [Alphaproteobacteria bacterium]